jgi:glycogen debranching enzyme
MNHTTQLPDRRPARTRNGAATAAEAHERLTRWTDFWLTVRRAPGAALPHYQYGNDCGWDNATTFDPARVTVTADLTAVLILQLDELARLADELGFPDDARCRAETADALQVALLDELWDGERFLSRPARGGAPAQSASLLDLMPIVLGDRLPDKVRDRLAEQIEAHLTAFGLATEHPGSPHYEPNGYWRGPIWAPPPCSSRTARAAPGTSASRTRSAPASAPCAKPTASH